MTVTDEKPKHFEYLATPAVVTALTTYSVALGMAYLWGYWSPFGINILDYMGIADILMATAWPLIGLVSSLLVGLVIGGTESAHDNRQDPVNKVGTAIVWYGSKFRDLHFFVLFLIWILDVPAKWYLLTLLGGVPLTVYLMQQPLIELAPFTRQVKLMVIFFVIAAPPMAISAGKLNAEGVMTARKFQVVYSEIAGYAIAADTAPDERLRMIGHRGETMFLWDPKLKRTVIAKFSSEHPLVIQQMERSYSGGGWDAIVEFIKKLG